MLRSALHHPRLLSLLCIALLVVRIDGAHLHLCPDGNEPPASLHLLDNGLHLPESGADAQHQDADLALADEPFPKLTKLDSDLPVFLVVALLFWTLSKTFRQQISGYRSPIVSTPPRFLRPPSRGPPLLTSH